jgi:hypothetical protein
MKASDEPGRLDRSIAEKTFIVPSRADRRLDRLSVLTAQNVLNSTAVYDEFVKKLLLMGTTDARRQGPRSVKFAGWRASRCALTPERHPSRGLRRESWSQWKLA